MSTSDEFLVVVILTEFMHDFVGEFSSGISSSGELTNSALKFGLGEILDIGYKSALLLRPELRIASNLMDDSNALFSVGV